MQNAANEALADIRIEPAGLLLGHSGAELNRASWVHALEQLESTGRSVVPRGMPAEPTCEVLTYRSRSTFGFLLDAAARFLESGTQEDAENTAHEARTVKALTVIPTLRHPREEAPPADATDQERFDHRVTAEGNGFLALRVAELTALRGLRRPARGLLPSVPPSDPMAFVVVWNTVSAPGLLLSGMSAAHTAGEHGAALLQSHLATAAQALIPEELYGEWS
ncbi:hypothetical protein ACFWGI_37640 [Streptomyces niveus]|uniref:hypothetical protein n=1 Tax=Streptomyces niveus TaxID=193462 RepID=UPI003669E47F